MALDTYLGLIGEVGSWTGRADMSTARVDGFIDLTETWFNKHLRAQEMETTNGTLTYSGAVITHPGDWLAWKHLYVTSNGTRYRLKPISQEQKDSLDDGTTGPPAFYHVSGGGTRLVPTPDSTAYTISGTYFQKPPALGASQSTNWILTNHPDAYLFGVLAMMEGFVIDDPRIGTWKTLFQEAIVGIENNTANASRQVPTMRVDIDVQ